MKVLEKIAISDMFQSLKSSVRIYTIYKVSNLAGSEHVV